jgi:hypothetical protein
MTAPEGSRTVPDIVSACKSTGLVRHTTRSNTSFGSRENGMRCGATAERTILKRINARMTKDIAQHNMKLSE